MKKKNSPACYEYVMDAPRLFRVIKRWVENDKCRRIDYYVSYDLKAKRWACCPKCKGYTMAPIKDKKGNAIEKKYCKHIKGIIEQLKEPNMGILRNAEYFDNKEFDWRYQYGFEDE